MSVPNVFEEMLRGGGRRFICLEVNPPRGTDVHTIISRLESQLDGIDFLNVTDCALAKMRLAALPFAALLKQRLGREVMVNVSCRDRNLIAIQADLLAAWAFGVQSIVALTGDAVTVGDSPDRKGVFEVNSLGLLATIGTLNSGKDLAGHELKGAPSFCAGVVLNPNARNTGAEIRRLQKKKDAGAQYALTQPVFDEHAAVGFFREAQKVGVPLFAGLLPLKSASGAEAVVKVPGIRISDRVLAVINSAGDGDLSDFFVEHCLTLAHALRPFVVGFHVVSGATPLLALRLARQLARVDWALAA